MPPAISRRGVETATGSLYSKDQRTGFYVPDCVIWRECWCMTCTAGGCGRSSMQAHYHLQSRGQALPSRCVTCTPLNAACNSAVPMAHCARHWPGRQYHATQGADCGSVWHPGLTHLWCILSPSLYDDIAATPTSCLLTRESIMRGAALTTDVTCAAHHRVCFQSREDVGNHQHRREGKGLRGGCHAEKGSGEART